MNWHPRGTIWHPLEGPGMIVYTLYIMNVYTQYRRFYIIDGFANLKLIMLFSGGSDENLCDAWWLKENIANCSNVRCLFFILNLTKGFIWKKPMIFWSQVGIPGDLVVRLAFGVGESQSVAWKMCTVHQDHFKQHVFWCNKSLRFFLFGDVLQILSWYMLQHVWAHVPFSNRYENVHLPTVNTC